MERGDTRQVQWLACQLQHVGVHAIAAASAGHAQNTRNARIGASGSYQRPPSIQWHKTGRLRIGIGFGTARRHHAAAGIGDHNLQLSELHLTHGGTDGGGVARRQPAFVGQLAGKYAERIDHETIGARQQRLVKDDVRRHGEGDQRHAEYRREPERESAAQR